MTHALCACRIINGPARYRSVSEQLKNKIWGGSPRVSYPMGMIIMSNSEASP
jgi:hypothetical protein